MAIISILINYVKYKEKKNRKLRFFFRKIINIKHKPPPLEREFKNKEDFSCNKKKT